MECVIGHERFEAPKVNSGVTEPAFSARESLP